MHLHKFEKVWLGVGFGMIIAFLLFMGIGTFAMGMAPPGQHHQIDPDKVASTAPFDKPGLRKIGDNEYEAVMVSQAFTFLPAKMEVPAGATVHFVVTSPDVVHGFAIVGTNVNMTIVPGEVNHVTHTFDKPGEYLIICNEYCGTGHEMMATRLIVK